MISVASDYVEEFWAIGPPVSLCSLELSAPLILFVGLLQTLFTLQVSALNIEGIDSSIVLLVAGSGLAEPGVDILVQQRMCKLGRAGYQWELTTFESEAKERIRRVGFVLFREPPTTPNHPRL
ncbi:hypothetical protein IWW34DRAFT_851307 [Fusarium oxysporum f. sp. albedinis]|uniref:Uncharacterized protein n=2 Tax=Fusarium oxysporum TaxID=5507 RepID=A0A420SST6_FUSOX|nr:hypothetical protein FOWG_02594 [Fusarium oxysporum f. sp. lycopersici MN25]KAF5261232.1 hypothetical protein FOXYS1_8083 [Fusarium oxysporum]KAH7490626.1 hypothetical protein FOMA001_g2995 [Fusarium oxysporum f. sp. matthiolae]KAI3576959.1 hypothetical protein IWW34DRAFT_851307 [Fusarium oxysporum f. sp. albedinis]RYC89672.1 hypothetical protein BFJ63_vAg7524 [Fusarium oxysporum f. sp. narcissi]